MTPEVFLAFLIVLGIIVCLYEGEKIMSQLSDLKDSLTKLGTDVSTFITNIEAEVAALQKQIADLQAAGGGATAQDLVDLKTQADAIDAAVKAAPVVPQP